MDLLEARKEPSFKRLEGIILGLYAVLVGWITYYHEPWSDEAQSWLIARDSSLRDIFLKRLHYEGTPGLWHLLLWIFCRLHVSYTAMHWATALIAVAAIYILLRYSPFPPLVRAILPFSFYLVFNTAIIARSYSLVPILTFAACAVLTAKKERPLFFAILVGLLANTSAIAFLLALGLAPLYIFRPCRDVPLPSNRRMILAGSALMLLLLFAAYTSLPAPDISFGSGAKLASHPAISHLLSKITGIPQPTRKDVLLPLSMKPAAPNLNARFLAERFPHHFFLGHLVLKFVSIGSLAFFAVSKSNVLAFLFYAALLWWLIYRRALITVLPLMIVLIGGHYLGMGEHHVSIITAALIVPLWLAWSCPASISRRSEFFFQLVLLVVLVEQAAWTAHAAVYDISQPFDGSIATAHFILPKANKYRIANIDFDEIGILPYTSQKIFYNQSTTYWPWEQGLNPDTDFAQAVAQHPDFILDGEVYTEDTMIDDQIIEQVPHDWPYELRDKAAYLREHGYHETHRFCGLQPAQFGFYRKTCNVVYEPVK